MRRIAALTPLAASSAFAQCVMCFRTAAAQQAERAHVLNFGILIMMVPPILILAGLCCFAMCAGTSTARAVSPIAKTLVFPPLQPPSTQTLRDSILAGWP